MSVKKSGFGNRSEYTATYSGMRGVDFDASSEKGRGRFAYLENMYRDYECEEGRIESIPGFRKLIGVNERINAIFMQKSSRGERCLVIHAKETLFRVTLSDENGLAYVDMIGTVNDGPSRAFSYGYDLYLLDGKRMWKIPEGGAATAVGEPGAMPYVPTTFNNGTEYEQRNLLTDRFKERTLISSTDLFTWGSHEIYYAITDAQKGFCAAIGISDAFDDVHLHVPSYVDIGGEKFRVTEIADGAFANTATVVSVKLNEGITKIGRDAFSGCTKLFRVFGCDALVSICQNAFSDCTSLEEIYLGRDFECFGQDAFSGCTKLSRIYYAGDTKDFELIENCTAIGAAQIIKAELPKDAILDIPIKTPTSSIESVTVDGVSSYYLDVVDDGVITSVKIPANDKRSFEGKTVIVNAIAKPLADCSNELFSTPGYSGTGAAAVKECRICECFDGRIFLSGNPALPNTVIYSARNESGNNDPLYFGALNYFNDGIGAFPVVSMLAAGDSLAVFKSDDDGSGSIFYHTPQNTDSNLLPRVYPVTYVHGGIGAVGGCISFFDDPVFISKSGLCALDKKTINLERSIAPRSHNVNLRLLSEDLSKARLGKWCGYLVVSVGGRIYLADSRAMFLHECGSYEYEWYYLSGIGTYKNATRVYRYSSIAPVGYTVHPLPESKVRATVMSTATEGGELVYYTVEDGNKYAVHPTEEYEGGTFYPATALLATEDDLLIFGTDDGSVCIFNNDKRGVAPPYIAEAEDFNEEDYKLKYARRIHPYYYRFSDHTPTYALRTVLDDCGIPHMTKSTVKHSLAIKMAAKGEGNVICEVGTDRSGYSENACVCNSEIDFSGLDFAYLAFETADHFTVPISEKEKNWIEKEIALSSSDGAAIAVYSMSYRFTVKGRIKMKG